MWMPKYPSPQTEEEDLDLFPLSLKRSKEVNRHSEETELPVQHQNPETFWRPEVPLPCEEFFRCEPFLDPGLYSTSPAGMVGRHNRVSVGLTHDQLPHPSKLMRGKKRLQKGNTKVLNHLRELRRRQRLINALKVDKWFGATAMSSPVERSPTEARNEQLLGHKAGVSFSSSLMDNPDVPEADSSLTQEQFLFRGNEQFLDLAPGGNPMMAFVAETAQRSLLMFDDACATVNPEGSDVFPRSPEEEISLLQNLEFF